MHDFIDTVDMSKNLEDEITKDGGVFLVDMSQLESFTGVVLAIADSCPACHATYDVFRDAIKSFGVNVLYLDFLNHEKMSEDELNVYQSPCYLFFYKGQIMDRVESFVHIDSIPAFLDYKLKQSRIIV